MLIYRFMPDGTFVVGDTVSGDAEIAHQSSFWAKRARQQPQGTARELLLRTLRPNLRTNRGRSLARRNSVIIKSLVALAERQCGDAVPSALQVMGDA